MASENPPAPAPPQPPPPAPASASSPREAVEHQDQSIKVRKSQLFEPKKHVEGPVIKPFPAYLDTVPPAPLTPGIKAALWTTGVVVVLLFLAAMLFGRGERHRSRQTDRSDARPEAVVVSKSS
jgi:hypothetical protein